MTADVDFVFDGCSSGKQVVAWRGFELKDLQSAEEQGILQISADEIAIVFRGIALPEKRLTAAKEKL
jgi:hypothetical protein